MIFGIFEMANSSGPTLLFTNYSSIIGAFSGPGVQNFGPDQHHDRCFRYFSINIEKRGVIGSGQDFQPLINPLLNQLLLHKLKTRTEDGCGRTRTCDRPLRRRLLYPLSYAPRLRFVESSVKIPTHHPGKIHRRKFPGP